ncbi:YlxR family protein [Tumebacillus sp. ITR2]|uniref:YlxR family protein n=1 Tax=Tumebacillus amylolyticus TaxID=2801339 RepID=A0ABS1JG27_9BACL|nr:YlxR family protein [Tumebacillus amylolyticus]MBL0388954.1 YlxR family protein [Tumebacillus amylolyticus]
MKKIPLRKCVGCQEMKPKRELIRIVYNSTAGSVDLDPSGRKPGRGAYICRNVNCLTPARKKKALDRSLKTSVSEAIYDNLAAQLAEVEPEGPDE